MPATVVCITARVSKHAVLGASRKTKNGGRPARSGLTRDSGGATSVCAVSFTRNVSSGVSWKESLDISFPQRHYMLKGLFPAFQHKFDGEISSCDVRRRESASSVSQGITNEDKTCNMCGTNELAGEARELY